LADDTGIKDQTNNTPTAEDYAALKSELEAKGRRQWSWWPKLLRGFKIS